MKLTTLLITAIAVLLAAAGAAFAQVPHPDSSYVELVHTSGSRGFTTCPHPDHGDGAMLKVYIHDGQNEPITNVTHDEVEWSISTMCDYDLIPTPPDTSAGGLLMFILGCMSVCGCADGSPSEIVCHATVRGVPLNDEDVIESISYDCDVNGWVNPVDFALFAQWFMTQHPCGDFDWDWDVDPIDFAMFAQHFGHQE